MSAEPCPAGRPRTARHSSRSTSRSVGSQPRDDPARAALAHVRAHFPPPSGEVFVPGDDWKARVQARRERRAQRQTQIDARRRQHEARQARRAARAERIDPPTPWRSVGASLVISGTLAACATPHTWMRQANDPVSRLAPPATQVSQAVQLAPPRIVSMADEAGQQALRDGHVEAALNWFREASAANPDLVSPVNGELVALARLHRHAEALGVAQAAVDRGLQSPDLTANLQWLQAQSRQAQATSAPSPAVVRLEISNGTGVVGLARRTADRLALEGTTGEPPRVNNQGDAGIEQTELRIRIGTDAKTQRALVRKLAQSLGVSVAVVRTTDLAAGTDAQLVLGADVLQSASARMQAGPRAT